MSGSTLTIYVPPQNSESCGAFNARNCLRKCLLLRWLDPTPARRLTARGALGEEVQIL